MINYIEAVGEKVQIDEGKNAVEQFLITVYFHAPIANKALARKLLLPIPLVVAIKREFIKLDIVRQYKGISMTGKGKAYVEDELGYKNLDKDIYRQLIKGSLEDNEVILEEEMKLMSKIFANRPSVDLTVDQAHCTYMTSLKRALLALKHHTLINKKILCVGDDDLVSISMGIVLNRLYRDKQQSMTQIHVLDIDKRFLAYIEETAQVLGLPIICHHTDLKKPLDSNLVNSFDCFFTDPPYTLNGMELFLSRGITGLKKEKGLPVFFSFAHKPYDYSHDVQYKLCTMGLSIDQIIPRFNRYEGAGIIGNIGQLFVLHSTSFTMESIRNDRYFDEKLYTREVKNHSKVLEMRYS